MIFFLNDLSCLFLGIPDDHHYLKHFPTRSIINPNPTCLYSVLSKDFYVEHASFIYKIFFFQTGSIFSNFMSLQLLTLQTQTHARIYIDITSTHVWVYREIPPQKQIDII